MKFYKKNIIIIATLLFTLVLLLFAIRITNKLNSRKYTTALNGLAFNDQITAYKVLLKDIADKRLMLFSEKSSFVLPDNNLDTKVKVMFISEIIDLKKYGYGTFGGHYNLWLLRYASFQYVKGDKTLGEYLLNCIFEATSIEAVGTGREIIKWQELKDLIKTNPAQCKKILSHNSYLWEKKI